MTLGNDFATSTLLGLFFMGPITPTKGKLISQMVVLSSQITFNSTPLISYL